MRRRDASPRRRDASMRRLDASPRRRDASMRRLDASPRRRDASMRRHDASLMRRDASRMPAAASLLIQWPIRQERLPARIKLCAFSAGPVAAARARPHHPPRHCEEAQPTRQSSSILSPFPAALTS
jgi:hypothetical protein